MRWLGHLGCSLIAALYTIVHHEYYGKPKYNTNYTYSMKWTLHTWIDKKPAGVCMLYNSHSSSRISCHLFPVKSSSGSKKEASVVKFALGPK
jgi:hypothetical protein